MTRALRRASRRVTDAEAAEFENCVRGRGASGPSDDLPRPPDGPVDPKTGAPPHPPVPTLNGVDRATRTKLERGRIRPTHKLDLHGYRVAEAWSAVEAFVLDAQSGGHRCVRIVTGRKLRETGPAGALRAALPQIVASPKLCNVVLCMCPAPIRSGGDGAFHLLLRRDRSPR